MCTGIKEGAEGCKMVKWTINICETGLTTHAGVNRKDI